MHVRNIGPRVKLAVFGLSVVVAFGSGCDGASSAPVDDACFIRPSAQASALTPVPNHLFLEVPTTDDHQFTCDTADQSVLCADNAVETCRVETREVDVGDSLPLTIRLLRRNVDPTVDVDLVSSTCSPSPFLNEAVVYLRNRDEAEVEGHFANVIVDFAPSVAGECEVTLQLTTDAQNVDPETSVVDVRLRGTGVQE